MPTRTAKPKPGRIVTADTMPQIVGAKRAVELDWIRDSFERGASVAEIVKSYKDDGLTTDGVEAALRWCLHTRGGHAANGKLVADALNAQADRLGR